MRSTSSAAARSRSPASSRRRTGSVAASGSSTRRPSSTGSSLPSPSCRGTRPKRCPAARASRSWARTGDPVSDPTGQRPAVRRLSWLEVRWRQFRHAPRPVVRAVAASLTGATGLGLAYLAYDVALSRGARLPGGDLRALAVAGFIVIVLVAGSLVTYLVVPLP